MNLRCYCCGEKLGERFILIASGDADTQYDRVFVMRVECSKRAIGTRSMIVYRARTKANGGGRQR